MARFIIDNKVYDTEKMNKIAVVNKWYEIPSTLLASLYNAEKVGRKYDCELFCSKKGNWLLVHKDDRGTVGEAIDEIEAKRLLMKYDYNKYTELFGELEEA